MSWPTAGWARCLALSAAFAAGCAGWATYDPAALRAEVASRAPAVPPGELVVPFEVTDVQVERARRLVGTTYSEHERAQRLARALFTPGGFGLRYATGATATAQQTLRQGHGNCLGLASVFVGLARALGLDARYVDASERMQETRYRDHDLVVSSGHVTAIVQLGRERMTFDFGSSEVPRSYRVITDAEALGHFYNDRGYDHLEAAEARGTAVDWEAVQHDFWLSTQVAPRFPEAWSNLGIASARLGRPGEAEAAYREAIRHGPDLAAPRNNLGLLLLARGDAAGAREALEVAARLEPRRAHVQLNLAGARLRVGDRRGALEAARRALELRGDDPEASALLRELDGAGAGGGGAPQPAG